MAKDSFSLVDFHRYLTKFKNQLFEAKSQKLNFQVVTRHLEVINKKGPVLQRPCTKKKNDTGQETLTCWEVDLYLSILGIQHGVCRKCPVCIYEWMNKLINGESWERD